MKSRHEDGLALDAAADEVVAEWRARSKYLPGFGHRFHTVDPRRDPLLAHGRAAVADGVVTGDLPARGRAVERAI